MLRCYDKYTNADDVQDVDALGNIIWKDPERPTRNYWGFTIDGIDKRKELAREFAASATGYGDFAIANRVSKELGLTGPSMTIRTACSSSLMALHAACQALYAGDCSSAVVGGCNLILSPRMTTTMSELGVLSPQGNCRSFDARADGYARGEAVNAIHIKNLSHALRDGDPIRSVIRSVCINSDGPRTPLYIPSPESHELLIRRSHQLAGITDLSQTAMIECHGTGTMVGDIREGRAVAKVFGELGGVLIGSVCIHYRSNFNPILIVLGKTKYGTQRGSIRSDQHHQNGLGSREPNYPA